MLVALPREGREREGKGREGAAHNILTNLLRRSKKKPIWTPKTTSEAANAVTKARRLIPVESWAEPGPSGVEVDDWAAAADTVDAAKVERADDDSDVDATAGADEVVALIESGVSVSRYDDR